jgi:SpoVK/Ycf46/Vps4 family AAA+-type ATPase
MLLHASAHYEDLILFVDEVDGLIPKRGDQSPNRSYERQAAVNTFLSIVEQEQRVVMLAATNHPHLLDPAAYSRFPQRIWIDKPKSDMLEHIIRIHMKDIPTSSDVSIKDLANEMEIYNMTGRDVRNLIVNVVMLMIQDDYSECSTMLLKIALEHVKEGNDIKSYGDQYASELYDQISREKGKSPAIGPSKKEIQKIIDKEITAIDEKYFIETKRLREEIEKIKKSNWD